MTPAQLTAWTSGFSTAQNADISIKKVPFFQKTAKLRPILHPAQDMAYMQKKVPVLFYCEILVDDDFTDGSRSTPGQIKHIKTNDALISLIVGRRKCCALRMLGPLRVKKQPIKQRRIYPELSHHLLRAAFSAISNTVRLIDITIIDYLCSISSWVISTIVLHMCHSVKYIMGPAGNG